MLVEPGTVLVDKYRVDRVLGTGGMGRVVLAWHLLLDQPVAIKALLPHVAEDPQTVQRFLREAQATVRLRSEHITRVMDVATLPDGTPLMVMEYLDGDDLGEIVRAYGPQAPNVVVDLMLQACEGIGEAHSLGIIHRDIKPSNFFITRRPDGSQLLKILDFGISKTPEGYSDLTGAQTVVGTPAYMSPEQMRGARFVDHRSDVWSMGVVMYQVLAGRPPFAGETFAELVLKVSGAPFDPLPPTLPGGLAEIIARCLEKEPPRRIQNVGELAKLIAPYASDPHAGAMSAERVQRILAAPPQVPVTMRTQSADGRATPAPLTPASWARTGGSSVSHGTGQVSAPRSRGGRRGLIIAGLATVGIGAGIAGWIVSGLMRAPPAATTSAASKPVMGETMVMTATPVAVPTPAASPVPTPAPAPAIDAAVAPLAIDAAAVPVAIDAAAVPVAIDAAAVPVAIDAGLTPPPAPIPVRPTPVKPRPPKNDRDDLFKGRN